MAERAIIVGSVQLFADEMLANPPRAGLELHKLLGYPEIETILVGGGHSIFSNAGDRLLECLVARDDIWLSS